MKKDFLLFSSLLAFSSAVYAQPVITSFAPTSGPIGTPVIITGSGFDPNPANDIVYFGAVKANVTAANTTSLTVTVPTGATYQPVSVTTVGLTAYSTQPFAVTFPCNGTAISSSTFAAGVDYPGMFYPLNVAFGDIDGDGKPDMLTAYRFNGNFSLFRNTSTSGSISFATRADFTSGNLYSTWDVAVGDVDGDGKLDVVGMNFQDATVSVFRNTSTPGSISFAPKVDFPIGPGPWHLAIGDINGDGKPEIAVTSTSPNSVAILTNTSTPGTVSFATHVDIPVPVGPSSIAIGDLNGDGKPDVVAGHSVNEFRDSVTVLRNTSTLGSISFAGYVSYKIATKADNVAIADLDGDGKLDIVTDNVSVLRNTSTAGVLSFADYVNFAVGTSTAIAIGDFNGDGKPDVVTGNQFGNVAVLQNNSTPGTVSLATPAVLSTKTVTNGVAIADLDGDGKPDLAAATGRSNPEQDLVPVFKNQIDCPSASVLPLQLSAFGAQLKGNDGVLNWQTASEEATARFEVERSTDNRSYVNVGSVASAGHSSSPLTYSYTDKAIGSLNVPVVYYRLKMVDKDGRFTYSKTVALNTSNQGVVMTLYPNPNLGQFQVQLTGLASQKVQVQILDQRGSVVQTKTVIAQESSILNFSLQDKAKGLYFVRVVSDKNIKMQKVQVQ